MIFKRNGQEFEVEACFTDNQDYFENGIWSALSHTDASEFSFDSVSFLIGSKLGVESAQLLDVEYNILK